MYLKCSEPEKPGQGLSRRRGCGSLWKSTGEVERAAEDFQRLW
jgi:hypothetical protein